MATATGRTAPPEHNGYIKPKSGPFCGSELRGTLHRVLVLQVRDVIPFLPPADRLPVARPSWWCCGREGVCPEAGGCWRILEILAAWEVRREGRCSASWLCLPTFPACTSWACWGHSPILFCTLVQILKGRGGRGYQLSQGCTWATIL